MPRFLWRLGSTTWMTPSCSTCCPSSRSSVKPRTSTPSWMSCGDISARLSNATLSFTENVLRRPSLAFCTESMFLSSVLARSWGDFPDLRCNTRSHNEAFLMDLIVDDDDNHFLKHYNRVGNDNQSSPITITPVRKKKVDLLPKQTPACLPSLDFWIFSVLLLCLF